MAITFNTTAGTLTTGIQTAYPIEHGKAFEGMLSDTSLTDTITLANVGPGAAFFGHLIVASGAGCALVSGAAQVPLGIATSSKTFEDGPAKEADGRVGYPVQYVVNILRRGRIWVYTHEAVSVGDVVRVFHSAAPGKTVGRFGKTATAGKTAVLSNAEFLSSTTGAGLAIVEINGANLTLTADA